MALPELVKLSAEKLFRRFCADLSPTCLRRQVRLSYSMEGSHVTLFVAKAGGSGSHPSQTAPLAQFRFHCELGQWTLHYPGAQGRWHIFLNAGPTLNLERLLRHLDEDPLNLFWE